MAVMKTLLGRGPFSGSSMVVEDNQRIDNRSEQKPDNTKASKNKETGCFPGFSSSTDMQGRLAQKMNLLLESIAHTAKEQEDQTTIWEFQRQPLGENWQTPFLPPNMKWVAIDDFYMQSLGKKPPVDWKPVKDTGTDAEGWQYSGLFEGCFPGLARAHTALFSSSSHWHSRRFTFQNFRRRRLKPVMEGEVVPEAVSPSQVVERGPTKVVFEADLGIFPLAALISSLNADDWTSGDSPVASYLKAVSATEVSFGAWTAGQNTSGISGKARTMEMRMPLPPAPMRPKDTRCTTIWHLIANPTKVALESVVTSYDVPYGTCFNVVKCDTFYLDEDSHVRYVRTVAMEWLKPCWVRTIVETNAFAEVGRDGAKMAEVVKQWLTDRRNASGSARCKI